MRPGRQHLPIEKSKMAFRGYYELREFWRCGSQQKIVVASGDGGVPGFCRGKVLLRVYYIKSTQAL